MIYTATDGVRHTTKLSTRMSAFLAAFLLAISSLATTISPFVEQAFAAGGETLYVNTNSGDDIHTCKVEVEPCRTIGKAIENANPGDTIVVASGNYEEALSIDKSVSIIGAGQGSTTIKAPASFSNNGDLISISGSSVSVDMSDLSIDGVSSSYVSNGAGIHVYGGANANLNEVTVDGVRNDPATKKYLYGVLVGSRDSSTAGTATITNSTVSDYQRGGIYVSGAGSFATITNNTVQAGTGLPGLLNGIVVEFGANADIEGNTVKGNWYPGSNWSGSGIGIWDQATDATIVKNNTVTDNQVGVGIVTDNPAVLKNLDVSDVTGNETNARVDSVYYDSWGYWPWASPDTTYVDSNNTTDDYGVVMVDGHAVVKGYDLFDNLSDAIAAVKTGGTVELDSNTTVTHQVTVNKSLTLDGNNHTITAQVGTYTNGNVVDITGNNVELNRLTVDANHNAHNAVNTYAKTTPNAVSLTNLTVKNGQWYGLIVGGSNVTVTDLHTVGNDYAGVDVDQGQGVTSPSTLTIYGTSEHNDGLLSGIYVDDATKDVTVNDESDQYVEGEDGPRPNDATYVLKPADTTPPHLNEVHMYVNGEETTLTKPGDKVKVTAKFTDTEGNGVTQVEYWVHNFADKNLRTVDFMDKGKMTLDSNTGLWTLNFTVPATYQNGDPLNQTTDGNYINFRPMDGLENEAMAGNIKFTSDATAPEAYTTNDMWRLNTNGDKLICGAVVKRQELHPSWSPTSATDLDHYEYRSFNGDKVGISSRNLGKATVFDTNGWVPSSDGQTAFKVRAVDMAGNALSWNQIPKCTVTYDSTPPELAVADFGNVLAKSDMNFSGTAGDATSGLRGNNAGTSADHYIYVSFYDQLNSATSVNHVAVNSGKWSLDMANNPFFVSGHQYKVVFHAYDNVGASYGESNDTVVTKYFTYDNSTPMVTAGDFATWNNMASAGFSAINVGFGAKDFKSISGITVELLDKDGNTITTNKANQSFLDKINAGDFSPLSLSSPFVVDGTLSDTYCNGGPCWSSDSYTWTYDSEPPVMAKVTVTGTDARGNSASDLVNLSPLDESTVTFASLLPEEPVVDTQKDADTDPQNIQGRHGTAPATTFSRVGTPRFFTPAGVFGQGFTNGGGAVLGDSTSTDPADNADNQGQVKADETTVTDPTANTGDPLQQCAKFFGLCWYWYIPIVIVVVAILYWLFKPRYDNKSA